MMTPPASVFRFWFSVSMVDFKKEDKVREKFMDKSWFKIYVQSRESISMDSMLRIFMIRFMTTLSSNSPVIPIPLMLMTSYLRKRKISSVEYIFASVRVEGSPY